MERGSGMSIYGDMYSKQFAQRSGSSQTQRISHSSSLPGGKQISMGHHTLDAQRIQHISQNVFPTDVYGNPFTQNCYFPLTPERMQLMTAPGSCFGGTSGSEGSGNCNQGSNLSADSGYHQKDTAPVSIAVAPLQKNTMVSSMTSGNDCSCSNCSCCSSDNVVNSNTNNNSSMANDSSGGDNVKSSYSQATVSSTSTSNSCGDSGQKKFIQASKSPATVQPSYAASNQSFQRQERAREKQLFCDFCGKHFTQEYLMHNHRRTHTGERPFGCDICGKQFGRRDTLQRHKRNHERPQQNNVVTSPDINDSRGNMDGCMREQYHPKQTQPTPMVTNVARRNNSMSNVQTYNNQQMSEPGTVVIMPFSHENSGSAEDKMRSRIKGEAMPAHSGLVPQMPNPHGDRSSKMYQCDICFKPFAQRHYLRIHKRSHTGEKPYQCDFCIQKFARRDTLLIHRRTQHTGERPHHCELCGEAFYHRSQLKMHRRAKHVLKASNSNSSNNSSNTSNTSTHNNNNSNNNNMAQYNMNKDHNNMNLSNENTGMFVYKKRYQCDYCFKQFAQRYYLQIHRRIHTGEKLLHCDVCYKKFTQKHYLQIHKRTHTGEKPFQCDFCIQKFARKTTLQIHRRTHTGERPYQCDVCLKQFAQRDKLTVHRRTHNPKRRYQCDICFKQFAQRHYLQLHQRSHTGEKPFQCDICFKQFSRKNSLQMHTRSHTGEKPFHCDICFKQFAQRQYLQLHKRTHTGEKAYQCDICAKHFARRDTLQRHKRIHLKNSMNPSKNNMEELSPMNNYLWQL
ncbi:zinc finger protein 431 [Octopus bimaculoides]|uniref:C2H2-type domain-containing protein n=1 Tax=Octopus bimaculoides TaxID=37653 RepID=A0A0L8HKK6_OCTBM|nr:zinc finger protein 431 [Octopus bimaculoides]XP_014771538.1 zinc finger protein 431 [Octopus bimaculoides]|eukprot:XP_014771537.1 PREDICTED: zinc finger protein 431-like [Octopus bimaculoides]